MGRNGILQWRRKRIRIGLLRGFNPKVNHRLQQSLHFRRRYLRYGTLEDQGNPGSRGLIPCGWSHRIIIELNMTEEAMLRIGAAIEIEDDAVALDGHCRYDHA